MATLYGAAIEVLGGIVGPVPAQMCMHSTCVALGKSSDGLTAGDFDAVAAKIRADMGRFASPDLIENALSQIRERL